MFNFLRPYFSGGDMAVDFGSSRTRIYVRGKGIVLDEPSVAAISNKTSYRDKTPPILAVGDEAMRMGKQAQAQLIQPFRDGVIADFPITKQMLERFIRKARPRHRLALSPRVIVCVPCGSSQLERDTFRESALRAGAAKVCLMEYPMAAAIGAGLAVSGPSGSLVVDIGEGITDIAVIALGDTVYKTSSKVCSRMFDDEIVNLRRNRGMVIGPATAERIKKEIGLVFPDAESRDIEVCGRHLAAGERRRFTVSSRDVRAWIADPLAMVTSSVCIALENTPPELGADIAGKGITLTGGGALLRGLDRHLQEETGGVVPVTVAQDPANCTIRGCGQVLEHLDEWLRDENCQWLT
jgi:rod shape-determining protein MreB